jgi:hypothetical protein
MFAKAVALSGQYTRPVIISRRSENKEIASGIATYVVLNDAGWAVTAAHVVQGLLEMQKNAQERAKYHADVDAINANPLYSSGKKKHELGKLICNPAWLTNHSLWWGIDGIGIQGNVTIDPAADLAIVQLAGPLHNLNIKSYPTFGNPDPTVFQPQGMSLCRLGYPFHEIKSIFDEAMNAFSIPNLPHLNMFPNDGILTRHIMHEDVATKRKIRFMETSSAGLLGQSGGPIFDTNGTIWAIQVKTTHLALGFSPKVKFNGKEIVEHQFMHCGWGAHVSHLKAICDQVGITYNGAP